MTTANIAATKVVPTATTLTPYYDDFDEDKNFHRIIARPGYALQAREFTQLQTMLQNQIERFGNHIFQNGSLVLGGQMHLDPTARHINLKSTYIGTAINARSLLANTITYASGNASVRAYVYGAREAINTDPPTLIVKYLTGTEFNVADTSIKSTANVYANTAASGVDGPATIVSINDGIFFINGYFVKVPTQTVVVSKYSNQANAKIGLEYTEAIITEDDDSSLLDPAQESSNYQAPGAVRLQINFDLAIRSLDSTDDSSFVEMMRVENGIIKKQITVPLYSAIGDELARRTFDESGSYTVRKFGLAIDDHPTDNTKLQAIISPGKAYIKGYEYESIAQQAIDLNKARDLQAVTNRNTTITVGNYVNVSNVANTFDTSGLELIDLHSVVSSQVNVSSATTYAATKIGTARVSQVRYFGSDNSSDANNDVLSLSIFDFKPTNLTSNAVASSANGLSLFDVTNKFAAIDNAYVGSTVRITSGPSAGENHTIVKYTAATKTLNIADRWITGPTVASGVSVDFDFDSTNSLIKNTTYTPGAPPAASANVHISSKNSANGYARLYDTDTKALVFDVGDSFLAANTLANQSFQYSKYMTPTAFSAAGVATIALSAGETFYSTNDSTGIASTTLNGIMAFRTNNGKRIALSNVFIDGAGQTATLSIPNEGATVPFKAYVRVNVNSGSETKPKTKTLRSANTTHILAAGTSLTQNTSVGVTTTTVSTASDATGQAIISNPSNTPNEWMRLYMADVKTINAIYDLDGAAIVPGTPLSTYNNVTNDFVFDNGQRDMFYDFANISLKSSAAPKKGPLVVCFSWYDHSSGSSDGFGYFSVDSYIAPETYLGIPTYIAEDGVTEYPLRDAIDFRPVRTNKTQASPNYQLDEARIPYHTTGFKFDYQYYLPRKSTIIMTKDLANPFQIIDGKSAKFPLEPALQEDSMVLYKLILDPYTGYRQNVDVKFVENKRYTMRDIGRLETRIANLEYYQQLNLLETSAASMSILDINGLERTKYGIITDNFTTQAYGDVTDPDYFVSIDTTIGGMQPALNVAAANMVLTSNTNTIQAGQAVLLQYTEEAAVVQNNATKWVAVQPYMLAQWIGSVILDPPDCNWIETRAVPDVLINNGVNDAITVNYITNNPLATKTDAADRWLGLPI